MRFGGALAKTGFINRTLKADGVFLLGRDDGVQVCSKVLLGLKPYITDLGERYRNDMIATWGLTMTDEKIHAIIAKESREQPYVDLWHAANVLEKQANEDPTGSTWKFMSALILTAFAWEAYLNQVGTEVDPTWPTIEKKLNPKAKVKHIADKIGAKIDVGRSPYQEINELHELRNNLAHPKPGKIEAVEVVFETPDVIEEIIAQRPPMSWERLCVGAEVKRLREAVKHAILELHKLASISHSPFTSGVSTSSATIKSGL